MGAINWKRFQQAYLAARQQFLPYDGVLGVGYGPRRVKGEEVDELAIVVLVRQKLAPDQVPTGQLLPRTVESFPIDVREPHVESEDKDEHKSIICRSDLMMIDWGKVHRMHLEELAKAPPADPPKTAVVGQVFVIEDNGTLITDATGFESIDWALAYQYFLKKLGDDYDFVAMYVDTASDMPHPGASFGDTIFNDVVGINHWNGDNYNNRPAYSTSRLQGLEVMLPFTFPYVRLQEIGHRWGAYVFFQNSEDDVDHDDLLSGDHAHWALKFDDDNSPMGFQNYADVDWVPNPDGSFTLRMLGPGEYAYCPLDLYLMGMYAPSEVGEFMYINNLTAAPTPGNPNRYTGTPVPLAVQNVVWSHLERTPTAAKSPRSFRQAFLVLTKTLDAGKALAATIDGDRIAHTTEFRSATRSRSVLDTYLYDRTYDNIYIKDNTSDMGIEASKGAFWNSPDIWVRNVDDGDMTHQDTIRGQDNFVYVRVHNSGAEPSAEITVNIFRADFAGTEFLYPEDWRLDDRIGSQVIASVPAGSEVVATFRWDKSMIPMATWHPCLLAEVLPIYSDPDPDDPEKLEKTQLLHHVSEDRRIAQKNITIIDPPPGDLVVAFPFTIGAHSVPARRVRIRVEQTEGAPVGDVALDVGQEDGMGRTALPRGGAVVERGGRPHLVVSDAFNGADIVLSLLEAERRELTLRLTLGERPVAGDVRFEITQLNERDEIVGGIDLLIKRQ